MQSRRKTYTIYQKASAIFMILALLWLTISAPFVSAFQQKMAGENKIEKSHCTTGNSDEEAAKPPANSTEEKIPGNNNSLSEEYLHDHYITNYFFSKVSQYQNAENSDIYIAFHGELLVPPPNAS